MASKKFAVKCGNFAVLVDLHILSQDPSKETSWFSEQKKESTFGGVCAYSWASEIRNHSWCCSGNHQWCWESNESWPKANVMRSETKSHAVNKSWSSRNIVGTSSHSEIMDLARRRGDGHTLSSASLESRGPMKDFIKAAGNHWGFPFQELKTGHRIQPEDCNGQQKPHPGKRLEMELMNLKREEHTREGNLCAHEWPRFTVSPLLSPFSLSFLLAFLLYHIHKFYCMTLPLR